MNQISSDYRTSHLHKGYSYDDDLSIDAWNAYTAKEELSVIRDIIQKRFPQRPTRCMDFACGTGRLTVILEDLAEECVGIDVSQSMLQKAEEKCKKSSLLLCDITKESPDLGIFDLITALRFFGNAQETLWLEVLSALYHYLTPDGYLILNNHRNPNAVQNLLYRGTGGKSNMNLSFSRLKRHARICGFEVVDLRGIGGWSLRHRWQSWVENPSKGVELLERMSRIRAFAALAPDWIAVLRKITQEDQVGDRSGRP